MTLNPQIHQSINPSAAVVRLFVLGSKLDRSEALRQLYATAKLMACATPSAFRICTG